MLEGEGFSQPAKKYYYHKQAYDLSSSGSSNASFHDIPWSLHMYENWRDKRITIRGEQLTKMDIKLSSLFIPNTNDEGLLMLKAKNLVSPGDSSVLKQWQHLRKDSVHFAWPKIILFYHMYLETHLS